MRTHYLFLCISVPLLASLNAAAKTTVTYIHSDILGSVIAKSNVYGRITERTDYEAYGEQTNGQKAGIGYTGHLEAPELGLTYMQQRYYDPSIGRFYSNDPVGFNTANLMTFNRYAYANNNPYKYVDPDGRCPVEKTGQECPPFRPTDNNPEKVTDADLIGKAVDKVESAKDGKVFIQTEPNLTKDGKEKGVNVEKSGDKISVKDQGSATVKRIDARTVQITKIETKLKNYDKLTIKANEDGTISVEDRPWTLKFVIPGKIE